MYNNGTTKYISTNISKHPTNHKLFQIGRTLTDGDIITVRYLTADSPITKTISVIFRQMDDSYLLFHAENSKLLFDENAVTILDYAVSL